MRVLLLVSCHPDSVLNTKHAVRRASFENSQTGPLIQNYLKPLSMRKCCTVASARSPLPVFLTKSRPLSSKTIPNGSEIFQSGKNNLVRPIFRTDRRELGA